MTRPLADSVFETTQTAGTGPLSLAGASAGYRRFRDAFPSGATVAYVIQQATYAGETLTALGREIGLGRLTHGAPDLLSRDVVLTQHGGAAAGGRLRIAAGGADVFVAAPAALHRLGARTVVGDVVLGAADVGTVIVATAGAGGVTVTLPDARHLPPGVDVGVVKIDGGAGDVNVQGHGGARIGGGTHRETTGDRWRLARYTWTGAVWLSDVAAPGLQGATPQQTAAGASNDLAVTPAGLRGAEITAAAWAYIDGNANPAAVKDSFNVSSITDGGVGDYTLNWTTHFANQTYAVTEAHDRAASPLNPTTSFLNMDVYIQSQTTVNVRLRTRSGNNPRMARDLKMGVVAFGELA